MALSFDLNDLEKKFLCKQAAYAINTKLNLMQEAKPFKPDMESENAELFQNLGSFVTLNLDGNLRGCIGTIIGHEPLWINVWHMARAAAFNDPRFPPVTDIEWKMISYEISVLDQPSPCNDPSAIVIGRDGLILQYQGHSGVFLPQVPVEQGWNTEEYLNNLCRKAGLPFGTWQKPGAALFWYQAIVFHCQ